MHRKGLEFRLGHSDVSAIRFGISPGHELANAVRVLARAQDHPLHWGWLQRSRNALPRKAFTLLRLVTGDHGYLPDFLTSPPRWDHTPADEYEHLRRTPAEQIRADLTKRVQRTAGPQQRALRELADEPERSRDRIALAWREIWDGLIDPYWPQIERLLRADIGVRSRQASTDGLRTMINTINRAISWDSDAVRVELRQHEEALDCAGSGLVLVPSVMSSGCAVLTEPPAQPTVFYPALGVSERWTSAPADRDRALADLFGGGRARLLAILDRPMTTSDVAAAGELAVSTASHHLAILRAAGLVDSRRDGGRVLHARTPLGEALLTG